MNFGLNSTAWGGFTMQQDKIDLHPEKITISTAKLDFLFD